MKTKYLTLLTGVFFVLGAGSYSYFMSVDQTGKSVQNHSLAGSSPVGSQDEDITETVASVVPDESHDDSNSLRILYHRLFKDGFGIGNVEKQLIEKFAAEQGLVPKWVEVDERWELLPAIYQNQGDVIVSQGYDVAGGLQGIIKFTEPWGINKHQFIAKGIEQRISDSQDVLNNREIALKRSSLAWDYVQNIASSNPGVEVLVLDEDLSERVMLEKVESGVYDVVVLDYLFVNQVLPSYEDLQVVHEVVDYKRKAWAVHKDNYQLQDQLNEFLNEELFAALQLENQFHDLPRLKEKGVIRLITYQSPTNVYYKDGELKGFEYELVKDFASKNNLRLNIVFAQSYSDMFAMLEEGKGDLISASVPTNTGLSDDLAESNAYFYSSPVLIGRKNEESIIDFHDLNGRSIALSAESPYKNFIFDLKKELNLDLDIKVLDKTVNTETLLFMVSLGIHDLTVIPNHTVKAELSRQVNLSAELKLKEPEKLVWLTRKNDEKLLSALNGYISENFRQKMFNSLKVKYITEPAGFDGDSKLISRSFKLTPYDKDIKKYSDHFGFDWRLIAAQMFQESQFDPQATSSAGAEGLMQIMPKTAEELGLDNLNDPVKNIEAGIRYLSNLRERFEDDLLLIDKNWFALAAYNAGYRRINMARNHAEKMGLNKNKWFGNVELAMREMASMKNKNDSRICRCGQTVVYVRDIRTRYNNYIGLTDVTKVAYLDQKNAGLF